jgi:hypothetical protein
LAVDVLIFISYTAGLTNCYVEVPVHRGCSITGPGYTLTEQVGDCDVFCTVQSFKYQGKCQVEKNHVTTAWTLCARQ